MTAPAGDTGRPPNIEEAAANAEAVAGKAQELLRAVRSLPKVEADGSSECPFAEELYAKKQELEQEIQNRLQELQEILGAVEQQIGRIKNDMVVISAHQDRLHGDRPREHFSEAEAQLAALYKRYLRLRDRIAEIIEAVRGALAESLGKQFPGGKPRKYPWAGDDETPAPPQRLVPPPQPGGADEELQNLFDLDRKHGPGKGTRPDSAGREGTPG